VLNIFFIYIYLPTAIGLMPGGSVYIYIYINACKIYDESSLSVWRWVGIPPS
jgi:hypothetical protein